MFRQTDPLQDKYPGLSSYNYVLNNPGWSTYKYGLNNPLIFIDPNGMNETRYEDENGNTILNTADGIDKKVVVLDDQRKSFDMMAQTGEKYGVNDTKGYNEFMTNKIEGSYNTGWQRFSEGSASLSFGVQIKGEIVLGGSNAGFEANVASGTLLGGSYTSIGGIGNGNIDYAGKDGKIGLTQTFGGSMGVGGEASRTSSGYIQGGNGDKASNYKVSGGPMEYVRETRANTVREYIYMKQGIGGAFGIGIDASVKSGTMRTTLR